LGFCACSLFALACAPPNVPAASTVSLRFEIDRTLPKEIARVTQVAIDDVSVGMLDEVSARGVRVREGSHRISVESSGYFPQDQSINAQGPNPAVVRIQLQKLPE
jgi:hypothetical protein